MTRKLYLLIILLLISTHATAAPAVHLEPGVEKYNLGLHADVLEDQTGNLTIEQVSSPAYRKQWVQNHQEKPNFAFSDSVYWLRITLRSDIQMPKTWWFEVAFALQDYIDYYVVHEGKMLHDTHTGDRLPFDSRQVNYRNFLFKFEIYPNQTRQIYLRLQSHDGLHEPCPVILWDQQAFAIANGTRNLGMGVYFGIMLSMAIYNLFIFIVVKDRAYAYYVAYIISFLFWLSSYFGYSFQYLWPNSPHFANQLIIVSTCVWPVFMVQFIRYFLNTKQFVPWYDKITLPAIGFCIIIILISVTGSYAFGFQCLFIIGIPWSIATMAAAIICTKAGFRPAKFFLLAWAILLLSFIIFSLKATGILPPIFIFEKSIQIGSAIEVILLSLGLADRINLLKQEKYLAKKDAIRAFESSLKLKNDFITSISHELRTPMNAIIGGLQVTQNHSRKQLKTPLDIVHRGASDMMNLVNDILTHTEIQSDRLTIQSDHIAIGDLLKTLHDSYRILCEDRGLQLDWHVDETMPAWVCTDKEKLLIILSKLLDNAIKYTEQGQVSLTVQCDQSTVPWHFICVVQDTGFGIEQEKQEQIFESFIQSEGGLQRRYGGLGIGLSICKKLTAALGGDLRLKSIVGHGSTFTVTLPIKAGVEPVFKKNNPLASADLPVLVVEDNIVNQKIMIKVLEKIGYKAFIANHGKEAIDILEKETVSVILMDLQMPVMDGLTCSAKIRERKDPLKNIPIIAVTANLMDADKQRCIEYGMNDFLKKPITPELLRNSLLRFIEPGL